MTAAPPVQLEAYGEAAIAAHANPERHPAADAAWKHQVAERLVAHRNRKQRAREQQPMLGLDLSAAAPNLRNSRVARVAEAVAARYAAAPTYRDLLAAHAEAVLRQAEAAVAAAAHAAASAEAAAVAQQNLLDSLELSASAHALDAVGVSQTEVSGHALAIHEAAAREGEDAPATAVASSAAAAFHPSADVTLSEAELDEWLEEHEDIYASAPTPPSPLPTNLIEFPRQLVAPRKARPRLAEGPLREESDAAPENAQLSIFEVAPEILANLEPPAAQTTEWSSLRLDAPLPAFLPVFETDPTTHRANQATHLGRPPQTAPLGKRVFAGAVDAALIVAGFLAFAAAFLAATTHPPPRMLALAAGSAVLFAIGLGYFFLFFTLADSTPGMMWARIGLCTFDDENPTRRAMRRRIAAMLLSACPLGLGFAWAWLDHDRLAWHDRITRMYPRSY